MKANDDKCYLLITIENSVSVNTDGSNVKNKREKKLLGIKFDSFLSFEGHAFLSFEGPGNCML